MPDRDEIEANRRARRALERRRARAWRMRTGGVLAIVALVAIVVALVGGGGGGAGRRTTARRAASAATGGGQLAYAALGRLPAPVQDAASAVLPGGRVVLLGGLDSGGRSTAQVTLLDGASATPRGHLPMAQHDAAAGAIGGAVYVFGGGDLRSFDHILRFDSRSGRVTYAGRLPRPSSDVAVAVLGTTAYIVGGYDGRSASPDIVAWSPGSPARIVGHLPAGVRYAAVAAIAGRVVIAGGSVGASASDEIWSFDPASGATRLIGRLPTGRTHAAAASLGGRVYLIGGRGASAGSASAEILAIDPTSGRVSRAGRLVRPLSDLAAVSAGPAIEFAGGRDTLAPRAEFGQLRPAPATASAGATVAPSPAASVADAIVAGAALPGDLLIADRGNNRVLLVTPQHRIVWSFPTAADLRAGRRLSFDDDVFVAPGGRALVANEEDTHVIVSIDIATHALSILYGHPNARGAGPGYLNTPDDAYPLGGGTVVVADAYNCRVLYIRAHRVVRQLGRAGACAHDPPRRFGDVNGDTPLPGGGVLISEISGSWVDAVDGHGRLLYAFRAPVAYPSDPQPLGGGRILLADYSHPGQIVIVDRRGRLLWRYGPRSGRGELDHPSLAVMLPNGDIAVNDDYRNRVVVIDPRLRRIVWQYGRTDRSGTAAGLLRIPDGMDFVPTDVYGRPDWGAVSHP